MHQNLGDASDADLNQNLIFHNPAYLKIPTIFYLERWPFSPHRFESMELISGSGGFRLRLASDSRPLPSRFTYAAAADRPAGAQAKTP